VKKLLIVDDDLEFAHALKSTLIKESVHVDVLTSGLDCLQVLQNFQFDLVLLDWNLPDLSGLEVCIKFRSRGGTTPIIFLTGRQAIDDKESGLDAGGDDYLTNPIEVRELQARMRSVERRANRSGLIAREVRGVSIDPKLHLALKADQNVRLSMSELDILEFFMNNTDTYFSAKQIFAAVWPSNSEASEDVVRVHMNLLRRRLSRIGADNLIETVRGAGYILRSEV
jgi:DNA-binding response OmpR family regulator